MEIVWKKKRKRDFFVPEIRREKQTEEYVAKRRQLRESKRNEKKFSIWLRMQIPLLPYDQCSLSFLTFLLPPTLCNCNKVEHTPRREIETKHRYPIRCRPRNEQEANDEQLVERGTGVDK